jgi:hypothetical protein
VFILEHYFASKSHAAFPEAFINVYPDKEVPNKTIHRLVTKFRDAGSARVSSRRWCTCVLFCKVFRTNKN